MKFQQYVIESIRAQSSNAYGGGYEIIIKFSSKSSKPAWSHRAEHENVLPFIYTEATKTLDKSFPAASCRLFKHLGKRRKANVQATEFILFYKNWNPDLSHFGLIEHGYAQCKMIYKDELFSRSSAHPSQRVSAVDKDNLIKVDFKNRRVISA